jgi:hypothetical protein
MIGFVLTCNQSKTRPNGFYVVDRFLQSLHKYCDHEYKIYLFDNSSEEKFDLDKYKEFEIEYTYVEDQTKRGNTGPWNDGVIAAINDGADQVYVCNDDLILNKSINNIIKEVASHENNDVGIYGPLCQPSGVLGGPQGNNGPVFKIWEITGTGEVGEIPKTGMLLNGFLFGFTKEFYHKYKLETNEIFNPAPEYNWNANECEFQLRLWKQGARSFIVGSCWIYHEKIRSWKAQTNPGGNQATMSTEERLQNSADKLKDYEDNWKDKFELFN